MARLLTALALAAAVVGGAQGSSGYGELERLPTHKRIVALTFDGGDNAAAAERILSTLKRYRVSATFFVTGRWVRRFPRLARAIAARYPIGNHTYDHAQLTRLSSSAVQTDVSRGAYWIRALTGREPRPLFRFPYGDRDGRTIAIVRGLGYVSVRWSLDTWGWMGPSEGQSTATVLRRVTERLARGDVILMHLGAARDGSTLDADALGRVIAAVKRRGYTFVTLEHFVRTPR